jgi:hypothetical protein
MSYVPLITGGLPLAGANSLVLQGLSNDLQPAPVRPTVAEQPPKLQVGTLPLPYGTDWQIAPNSPQIYSPNGAVQSVPQPGGWLALGDGQTLQFDQDTLRGRITPSLSAADLGRIGDGAMHSFTGSDLRIMIELVNPPQTADTKSRCAKQLLEGTTISISTHRVTNQVRALGYINPKGFSLGGRTVAGSIVLTQFTVAVLLRFLDSLYMSEISKDSFYNKVDQLPPFNFTLLFSDEYGYASYQRLLGVRFVDDGVVYSNQDMYSEQTLSYLATDLTPLLPLDLKSFQYMGTSQSERSPRDAAQQIAQGYGSYTGRTS